MIGTGIAGLGLSLEALRARAQYIRTGGAQIPSAPRVVITSLVTDDGLGNAVPAFVLGVNDIQDGDYWIP